MKRVVFIVVSVLILLAIPVTVYLVRQRQELRKKAAPATTLSLTPATVTKQVGETFSLEVTIDTGENQVVAAEVHLIFDPDKLEAQTITNSTLFPNILTSGVVDRGTASITVGAADVKTPIKGGGTVAVARFKALAGTTSPISVRFAQNTFVGGLGEGSTNVLVGSTPATVTVTGAATVTPTATPSGSLLSTSPTPTLIATGSAQATSSAVQIVSPGTSSSVSTTTPTIKGKAPPGSTVTLTVYSTPQTIVVKADSSGNWSYTFSTPLDTGPHNVVASATDTSGQTQTATTSFVVAAGASGAATQSAIPVSGNISWTYILIASGLLLLATGLIFPVFW